MTGEYLIDGIALTQTTKGRNVEIYQTGGHKKTEGRAIKKPLYLYPTIISHKTKPRRVTNACTNKEVRGRSTITPNQISLVISLSLCLSFAYQV